MNWFTLRESEVLLKCSVKVTLLEKGQLSLAIEFFILNLILAYLQTWNSHLIPTLGIKPGCQRLY